MDIMRKLGAIVVFLLSVGAGAFFFLLIGFGGGSDGIISVILIVASLFAIGLGTFSAMAFWRGNYSEALHFGMPIIAGYFLFPLPLIGIGMYFAYLMTYSVIHFRRKNFAKALLFGIPSLILAVIIVLGLILSIAFIVEYVKWAE